MKRFFILTAPGTDEILLEPVEVSESESYNVDNELVAIVSENEETDTLTIEANQWFCAEGEFKLTVTQTSLKAALKAFGVAAKIAGSETP